MSVAPRNYSVRRDDVDYIVFCFACFAKPEDADVFPGAIRWRALAASPPVNAIIVSGRGVRAER
jgi:hypothetical protein